MKSPETFFKGKLFLYLAFLFLFVLLDFLAYYNVLQTFFLADDFELIKGVRDGGPFSSWRPGAAQGFFRPLVTLSIFMDYRLWGLNPTGYHATNLIFHALNSFLVFSVSLSLLSRINLTPINRWLWALLSGIIFLWLPCHTESVSWISGRTDLIATLFCLSSFLVYLVFQKEGKGSLLSLSMFFFFLALLAKESVITFPLLILCYEGYEGYSLRMFKGRLFRILWVFVFFLLVFILYMAVKYWASGTITLGYGNWAHFNINPIKVLKDYLIFLTRPFIPPIPVDLQTFIYLKSLVTFNAPMLIGMIMGILSLVLLMFLISRFSKRLRRIRPHREMFGLILFLFFASVILFIPALSVGLSIRDIANERLIYFPSAYYSVLLTLILLQLVSKRFYRVWMFLGLFLFFIFSLQRFNGNWRVAAEISRNSVQDLLKYEGERGKVYLICVPGEMKGAVIHSNIQDAVDLFGTPNPPKLIMISWLYMCQPEDGINVTKELNSYNINTTNSKGYFFSFVYPLNQGPVKDRFFDLVPRQPDSYNLHLKEVRGGDRLMSLSQGRLICLEKF